MSTLFGRAGKESSNKTKIPFGSCKGVVRDNIQYELQHSFLWSSSVGENASKDTCVPEITSVVFFPLPNISFSDNIRPMKITTGSFADPHAPDHHATSPLSPCESRKPQPSKFHGFSDPITIIYGFIYNILLHVYSTITTPTPLVTFVSFIWLCFTGSFLFDVVHYLLHQCSKSQHGLLRRLGYLHQVHHLYFNRNLKFNNKYHWLNMCIELPLELSCQLFGTWLGFLAAHYLGLTESQLLSRDLFILVLWFEVARELVVAILDGRDSNHKSYVDPPKDPNWLLVGPQYHALHHIDPTAYISSNFRVFDWILGTGYSLRSRRITMAGAPGAFGSALKRELEKERVKCIQELRLDVNSTDDDDESRVRLLANTDVLILTHGSQADDGAKANCESVIKIIELFKRHHSPQAAQKMLLPEVWHVGSETKLHHICGQGINSRSEVPFLPHARTLYDDRSILYRHIVLFAQSPNANQSLDWAARIAMWWIRRGARYVPATYTGFAYLNYFRFMHWVKKA